MQGGPRGSPVPAMREADARASFAGFGTATCDAGVTRIPAVFGLPFELILFLLFAIYSQRDKTSRSFTLAPRCPVSLPVPAGRVVCPPRDKVGTNRLTACDIFKVTVTLPSPV